MITPKFCLQCMTKTTNLRAAMEGAGNPDAGKNYPTFKPFTDQEMDKCIGLLILNGCHPKPQVDQWFLTPQQCSVFGNNIGPHIFRLGVRRYREFRRFFCMYDARIHPAMPEAMDKLFKIRNLLNHLLETFKQCWTPGKSFSVDEQTI